MSNVTATVQLGGKGLGRTVRADELTPALPAELAGCERLVVSDPVVLGVDVDDDLRLLWFLREATSRTLRVDWVLDGRPSVAPREVTHLVPPRTGTDAAYVAAWRAAYRYGSYHYRRGPGFVTVKDVRPDGPPVHLTIDGGSAEHFLALADTGRIADLAPDVAAALDDAVEFGLAVRGVAAFLLLPFRMRHWPVPYVAA
jgi:hypothetical protein